VDSLWIHLVRNEWVKEWTLLRTTQHKKGPLVVWTDTSSGVLRVLVFHPSRCDLIVVRFDAVV
jgi:hypothetical protein